MPSAASKMPNLTGTILNERFKLIRTLGSGSYGVVYQAVDLQAPADDCDRAIKLVSKGDRKNSTFSALRREMALHKRASEHPNVITLHEAYEDQEYFVFVMDYCRGGDLGKYLTKKGPYEDGEKLRKAFLGLLDAVDSLHKQKIYHRDLKPQNILVSEDGSKLFIADFGLSSEKNIYSGSCGTPAYMPPGTFSTLFDNIIHVLTPSFARVSQRGPHDGPPRLALGRLGTRAHPAQHAQRLDALGARDPGARHLRRVRGRQALPARMPADLARREQDHSPHAPREPAHPRTPTRSARMDHRA